MRRPSYVTRRLARTGPRRAQYLGSFPAWPLDEFEQARRDDIAIAATRAGLMLNECFTGKGRWFVLVQPHPNIHPSHFPDVSKIAFGDLKKGESEGYQRKYKDPTHALGRDEIGYTAEDFRYKAEGDTDEKFYESEWAEEREAYWKEIGLKKSECCIRGRENAKEKAA